MENINTKLIELKNLFIEVIGLSDFDNENEVRFAISKKVLIDKDHFIDFINSSKWYRNNICQYIFYLLDYNYENVEILQKKIKDIEDYWFNKEINGKRFFNINKIYLAKNKEYIYLENLIDKLIDNKNIQNLKG